MTGYAEFRLRIDRGLSAGTYRVVATGSGGEALGRFKLPFSDLELENFVLKVGRTRRGRRRVESPEMELAKDFGGRLFSALFDGDVRESYRSSSADARNENRGLRITLSLSGAPELSQVPWEYLYDHPSFLSISTWTPIVRYLDLPKPRRPLQITLPLRILGVVSAPSDAEPIDVASEKAKLGQALAPLVQAGAVAIDWLETATLRALQRQLRVDDYHVLHYIGHGGYDHDADDGIVLFEDDAGRSRRITGVQLGTILQDEVSLRLAVLNACEGGRSSREDPFSGVAVSLIEREIPAVIGMQFEITDRSAIVFASEFYSALADGFPVDAAMAEARKAIYADENDLEWATPVLFMRVLDGLLFEVPEHAPARDQKPDPTVAVAAAKAEAEAVNAGADPAVAAAAATAAASIPTAAAKDAPTDSGALNEEEPAAVAALEAEHETEAARGSEAAREAEAARDAEAARERIEAEAAERERLRAEVKVAREREREAVAERDRLAAEAETSRAVEKARREREAEAAAREQTNAGEAQRVEEERQRSKEAAEASAAEAARLETQRVWIAGEVNRLKSERRQLEAELRAKRDASAGRVDPAVAQPRPSAGQAKKGASGANAEAGWSATTMGSARSSGGASTTGRAKTARTWTGPKPGIDASRWMATRRNPNRGAAAARGFLAGALLVGTLSALYIYNNHLPPQPIREWGAWFEETISNRVVPGLTLGTILIATFGGMLIELLVPLLRAPARDASRWLVVLVLGLTLGPLSFYVSWNALDVEAKAGPIDPFQVVVVSVLAFLVAELWMARGSKDARPSG